MNANEPTPETQNQKPRVVFASKATAAAILKRSQEDLGAFPIHQCLIPQGLFATGFGTTIIARKINQDEVVVGGFLLDVYCLGVRSAFLQAMQMYEYESTLKTLHRQENFGLAEPALVRALVEQSVEYARNLGFKPNSDYDHVRHIFGTIDPQECTETFTFGYQGKPLFVPGPNDAPKRCERIVDTLKQKCGPDGYQAKPRTKTGSK